MQSLLKEDRFEDNAHNRLLIKKMWAKEILEQWYSYYINYEDSHEFFDYEGNPWQPCFIEFDIVVKNPKKISSIFNSLPNLIAIENNSWVWIDNVGHKDMNYINTHNHIANDNGQSPSYRGNIMHNKFNKLSYLVLAEISFKKDKLIIGTNSTQRASIAQDFILTNCGDMVKNPVLIHKIKNDPNRSWN